MELLYFVVFWINTLPANDGMSRTHSSILLGTQLDFHRHCQLEFGTYLQTHDETDNTMRSRTTGALSLCPTGNAQGGYFFYNLTTAKILNRNNWTVLPMPESVIQRVHNLARRSKAS